MTLALLLVLTLRHEMAIRQFTAAPDSLDPASSSFAAMALALGTDKVTTHDYHHLYSKYLEPVRHDQLRVLEIGLGCDMPYGPGKSAQVLLLFASCLELLTVFTLMKRGFCLTGLDQIFASSRAFHSRI